MELKRIKKHVDEFTENGIPMVKVPTGKTKYTVLRKEDYDNLLDVLLPTAPPGYRVTYLDGNPLNLRRENLAVQKWFSKRDARAALYIEPSKRRSPVAIPVTELGVFGD